MRLKELGIREVFGVPGDFSFAINDAVCNDGELRWIGTCGELNAAYALTALPGSIDLPPCPRPSAWVN